MATQGFYFTRLEVRGHRKKRPAIISFEKGLNVVSGASDTGKSYILQCLDFMTGAGTEPEKIDEAKGYETVWVELRTWDKRVFTLMRSLRGGDAKLYECALSDVEDVEAKILKAKAPTKKHSSMSEFFLELCGLTGVQLLAKKKDNTKWALKFRAVAHLSFIDEVKIYAKSSPVYGSGIVTQRTMEESLFRYLITGADDSSIVTTEPDEKLDPNVLVRRDVIGEMIQSITKELESLSDSPEELPDQLERLSASLTAATAAFSLDREKLRENQAARNRFWDIIQTGQSRVDVLERLTARFALLDAYYATDLNRLQAMTEAGAYLAQLPENACPVCGTEDPWDADDNLNSVRTACVREVARIEMLQRDLSLTDSDIRAEIAKLENEISEAASSHQMLSQEIEQQLIPAAAILDSELQKLVEKQRELEHASALMSQRERLVKELDSLQTGVEVDLQPDEQTARTAPAATTSEAIAFCKRVRKLLKAWNFPGEGPVQFSEKKQDLVINGKERSSHGKGVRALSYSAFTIGLLEFCRAKKRPHPGVVLLDSPLVAYREPDSQEEVEAAGVAERFYRSLSNLKSKRQIIVFENRDPPDDLEGTNEIHFSGNISGADRGGFFPSKVSRKSSSKS